MSNCNVGQCVSGVTVEWQRVKWKKSPKAWYQPSGKCKKVCSCHITTNVPLKSFAVIKYTQLVTNAQPGCFSFYEHLRYCNTRDQPGCIEADRLSGSYFQMYFHDKHLFQIHHVPWLLSASHVPPWKTISATAQIDTNKVSWQWTLIIIWLISHHVNAE